MSNRKRSIKKQSDRNIGAQKSVSSINIEKETTSLLNDSDVQEDRVVRLAMLSILGLYCNGVSKEGINRLEIMNGTFFINVLENYRPELARTLTPNEYGIMLEKFCDGLKSLVRAMFICCLKIQRDNSAIIDIDKLITLRDSLQKDTWVKK